MSGVVRHRRRFRGWEVVVYLALAAFGVGALVGAHLGWW